jgi:hypothetical protein
MLEIDPRENHAGFMLNKLALGQSFLKVFQLLPLTVISPMLSCHPLLTLFSTNGESVARKAAVNATFVYPCIISVIVNDDQQDATILAHLFIYSQRYMFRAMSSPIIWST